MSHLPIGQVQSNTPNYPATKITQDVALGTQRVMLSTYSADVVLTTTGAKTIFTTAADKGRFVPIMIAAYCTSGLEPGGFGASVSVGWNPSNTQPYIDWVNQEGIASITTGSFGAGNYQIPSELPIQTKIYPFGGGIYVTSAPPSTNVVVYVNQADGATSDTRTFVITGFYTGA